MSEWRRVKLGDLGRVVTGAMPPTKRLEYYDGNYQFVTPSDLVYDTWGVSKTERTISDEGRQKYLTRCVPAGAVMYTCIASIGKIGVAKDTVLTNQQINSIIANDENDGRFIYHLLRYNTDRIRGLNAGCAVPIINKTDFENIEVSAPKLPTQRRIADILSAYDDLIENNRRRIEILEETARTVFQRILDESDGEAVSVGDIVEVNPAVPKPSGKSIRYVPMSALSTAGMTINFEEIEIRSSSTSIRFQNGDVLLARITPCLENGKTAFVGFLDDGETACGSSEFIVMRGRRVSPYFTYCLARLDAFRAIAIKSMVGASGRQRVQPSCFDDFTLRCPDKETLVEFDKIVAPMFEQITILVKQNRKLAAARDLLLPRLMSGKMSVFAAEPLRRDKEAS